MLRKRRKKAANSSGGNGITELWQEQEENVETEMEKKMNGRGVKVVAAKVISAASSSTSG